MKTPFTAATPALTRAQIDAIVSAGALRPASQSNLWQSDIPQSQESSPRDVIRTREGAPRGAQASVRNATVAAAAYGCVDWYLYPDSHSESEAA